MYNKNPEYEFEAKYYNKFGMNEIGKTKWNRLSTNEKKVHWWTTATTNLMGWKSTYIQIQIKSVHKNICLSKRFYHIYIHKSLKNNVKMG